MLKNDPYIIGISGPTGSGKTFITKQLAEKFRNHNFSVEIISTDDFYRDLSHLTFDERTKVNYDDPDSIDFGEFNDVLKRINQGEKVTINQYDFKTHTRINKQRTFNVANIIIVEGIFAFTDEEVLRNYSLTIFVELDSDLRIIRRIDRDYKERGRSFNSVVNQYTTTVKLTQELHVLRDKTKADLIIYGNKNQLRIVELIFRGIVGLAD